MSKSKCWCQQCKLWFDDLEQFNEFHKHDAIKDLKHNPLTSEICIQLFDEIVNSIGVLKAGVSHSIQSLNDLDTKILCLANQINSYSFEVPFRLNEANEVKYSCCLFHQKEEIIYFDLKYKGSIKSNEKYSTIEVLYPFNQMTIGNGTVVFARNCINYNENEPNFPLSLELSKHQKGYLQIALKKNYNVNPYWKKNSQTEIHFTGSIILSNLDYPTEGNNLVLYSLASKSYLCCSNDGWKFVEDYTSDIGCILTISHSEEYSTIKSNNKQIYLGSFGSSKANCPINEKDAKLIFEFASHKIGGIFMIHDFDGNYLVCNANKEAGFSKNSSIFLIRTL